MSSKSVSQVFKILFQTGDLNIFVLLGVLLVDMFKQKASFLTKKTLAVKSKTNFSKEAIKVGLARY